MAWRLSVCCMCSPAVWLSPHLFCSALNSLQIRKTKSLAESCLQEPLPDQERRAAGVLGEEMAGRGLERREMGMWVRAGGAARGIQAL